MLSEIQVQHRIMQLSYFANKNFMVDAFPYLADRSTFSMMINFDSVGWVRELQKKTSKSKSRKSMVATSLAVAKWDGPLMGVGIASHFGIWMRKTRLRDPVI